MQTETPQGVTGDVPARDGEGTSSRADVDRSFFGRERMIPSAWGGFSTPISTYYGGEETFEVRVGLSTGFYSSIWTDARGIDAMIDSLMALKVGAAHVWEKAA